MRSCECLLIFGMFIIMQLILFCLHIHLLQFFLKKVQTAYNVQAFAQYTIVFHSTLVFNECIFCPPAAEGLKAIWLHSDSKSAFCSVLQRFALLFQHMHMYTSVSLSLSGDNLTQDSWCATWNNHSLIIRCPDGKPQEI